MSRPLEERLRELLRETDAASPAPTPADERVFVEGVRARMRGRSPRIATGIAAMVAFMLFGAWATGVDPVSRRGPSARSATEAPSVAAKIDAPDVAEAAEARRELVRLGRLADDHAMLASALRRSHKLGRVVAIPERESISVDVAIAEAQAARVLLDRALRLSRELGPSDVVDRAADVLRKTFPDSESARLVQRLRSRS